MKRLLIFCAALLLGASAAAQRLPRVAVPTHYTLKLTPNLGNATFSGEESIDIDVVSPRASITLNAVEITFDSVSITSNGITQTATVTLDPRQQFATLRVARPLASGPAQIRIRYTGVLNDKLRGFYLSEAKGRRYAVTQFEPTEARRAFPSFDEPAYKATFDITVVAPKGDMAISNGPVASDQPGPGAEEHTVRFATTPQMSTYLVAVLVGPFQCIEGGADKVPIRVCTVPGRQEMGRFALAAAENFLSYYNRYFSMKYPYPKLDLIGIPDFEAGAMENTGAITFRDIALLADEKSASYDQLKQIALVVAHEMAHQWFGDLVTMAWWNDIWLNEGFATWMETKAVAQWKPQWRLELDEQLSADEAMAADSLRNTRPIRQQAETPAQINELFDAIAYNKTAAVLRMLESYLGPQVFQQGINRYLQAHEYANATAEDFWNALAAASKKPVDRIMISFVDIAGVPVVTPEVRCTGAQKAIALSQSRFSYQRGTGKQDQVWTIPVCTATAGGQSCNLLAQKQQQFPVAQCTPFMDMNAGATGYYRTAYSRDAIAQLAPNVQPTLSPVERLAIVNNEWALVRANEHSIDTFMRLAEGLGTEKSAETMSILGQRLRYITDHLLSPAGTQAYEAWVRQLLQPAIRELGWSAAPNDDEERRALRANVFHTLGYSGRDQQALAEAKRLLQEYMRNAASVDPTELDTVFALAVVDGTPALYDELLAQTKTAAAPDAYYRYLYALARFRDSKLLERTLEYALSPEVRSQDAPFIIGAVMHNPAGEELAWKFVRAHWTEVLRKSSMWGAVSLVHATGNFCSVTRRDQVQQFFAEHPVPAAQRGLKQALEQIDNCVALKSAQAPNLALWLQQNHVAAAGQ